LRKVNILNKSALIFELGRKVGNMGPQEVSKSTQISILQPPTRKSEIPQNLESLTVLIKLL